MRRPAWPYLIVSITLLIGPRGNATPLRLTLEDAITRALSSNLALQMSRKDIDFAESSVQRSRAWLPSNPFFSSGAQRTSQSSVGSNYAFFLQQEFEIAGQRRTRMDAAAQGTQKARWDVRSFEQDLVAVVRTAFVDALVSRDRVRLAEKGVHIAATLSQELARDQQLSEVQRLDLNVAQIQESRAQRQLAAAERTRDDSLDTLRRLLNLPIDQAIELQGAPHHEVRGFPPAVELIERALRQRPDLVALRHGAQQAARQLALTKREAIPNLTLSGSLSRFEGDTLIGGDIGLSLPIFHGKSADISDAIAERDRANLELHNLERTVAEETVDARRACVVAAGDLQTLRDVIVPKSEENLRLEEHLYKGGVVTVSELVGLQIDLLSAQSDYLDALQTYNDALVELERVIGGSIDSSP